MREGLNRLACIKVNTFMPLIKLATVPQWQVMVFQFIFGEGPRCGRFSFLSRFGVGCGGSWFGGWVRHFIGTWAEAKRLEWEGMNMRSPNGCSSSGAQ